MRLRYFILPKMVVINKKCRLSNSSKMIIFDFIIIHHTTYRYYYYSPLTSRYYFPPLSYFQNLIIDIPILINCNYTLPSINISIMKNCWVFTSLSRTNIRITFLLTFDELHCIYH